MKISIKLILTVVLTTNVLTVNLLEAGSFRNSNKSSQRSSSSRSKSSFNRGGSSVQRKGSSNFSSSRNSMQQRNPAPTYRPPSNWYKSKQQSSFSSIRNAPKLRTPIRPSLKPTNRSRILNVTGHQPVIKSPMKPLPGRSPITTRPGQSGDPDAGNPVNPLPNRGEISKPDRLSPGILPGDTPPEITEPVESPYPSDDAGNSGNQGGNYQEGDVTSGNGKVVDQEFLDLVNEGEFLHTGQPAPWDNPNDPFWDQEKPEDWKGHWPGNDPDFGVKLPEGPDLDIGKPTYPEKPEQGDIPPPIFDPPGDVPPYCPPGHIPPYCPPPVIIIDPIGPPPVFCPPCVRSVCRPVVVAPPIVEEQAILQLVTDRENTLMLPGLGNVPGNAVLQVNGLGLPLKVITWTNEKLVLEVPMIGLLEPTAATLFLFDAEMKIIGELPAELLTPEMAGLDNEME
ncbi:MAG: hypothetical protein P8M30_18955 [Planctomycetaceae bacterium]|nr:hypothetical protein [Planctomycetaceae bacterium]MDG2391392.1 hypothetical protein [Planctomycetaceae bacterium]